jgi:signal transduction histidine kinase/CheY-like chemotaxis protein
MNLKKKVINVSIIPIIITFSYILYNLYNLNNERIEMNLYKTYINNIFNKNNDFSNIKLDYYLKSIKNEDEILLIKKQKYVNLSKIINNYNKIEILNYYTKLDLELLKYLKDNKITLTKDIMNVLKEYSVLSNRLNIKLNDNFEFLKKLNEEIKIERKKVLLSIIKNNEINLKNLSKLKIEKNNYFIQVENKIKKQIYNNLKNSENQIFIKIIINLVVLFLFILFFIGGILLLSFLKKLFIILEKKLKTVSKIMNKNLLKDINVETDEGLIKTFELFEKVVKLSKKHELQAKEENHAKSSFLANMSHEIRTPLNGILGFTELLQKSKVDDEQQEFLNIIEKSSHSLLELINDILDLSKVESDKVELEEIDFNPVESFENSVEIYAIKAADAKINLSTFIDPTLNYNIIGDPTKISEVIVNLMSNAVKFTPANGNISVEIKKEKETTNDVTIYFSVQDSGLGIPKDRQKAVFEPFGQADKSTARKFGGTGLGLTISFKFIKLMGGEIEIFSKGIEGLGTRFFFTLTFKKSEELNQVDTFHLNGKKVALLDINNNKKQIEYIKNYTKSLNMEYFEFDNEKDLSLLISNKDIEYTILDAQLANISDLNDFKLIATKPVILIKATEQQKIKKLKEIGFDKFIYEPVNTTKLINFFSGKSAEIRNKLLDVKFENSDYNILVAEDNKINQRLIVRVLEDMGNITVDIAENGEIAFEKRKEKHYDVIFMDIEMPVLNGLDSTDKIIEWENENGKLHIPIIALTADALKGKKEEFIQHGMSGYTTKPLVISEIVKILQEYLH